MEKLKRLIEDNAVVSLRELEKDIGVCRQTLGSILNGKHKPTVLTVKKICNYFKVNYRDYLGE